MGVGWWDVPRFNKNRRSQSDDQERRPSDTIYWGGCCEVYGTTDPIVNRRVNSIGEVVATNSPR